MDMVITMYIGLFGCKTTSSSSAPSDITSTIEFYFVPSFPAVESDTSSRHTTELLTWPESAVEIEYFAS
jgi:hypothetical protein